MIIAGLLCTSWIDFASLGQDITGREGGSLILCLQLHCAGILYALLVRHGAWVWESGPDEADILIRVPGRAMSLDALRNLVCFWPVISLEISDKS